MTGFEWHDMADEQPNDRDADYLLVGNRGALYIGQLCTYGDEFYVRNNRSPYLGPNKIKAWAKIPAYGEGE